MSLRKLLWGVLLLAATLCAQSRPQDSPQYWRMPGLKERAALEDGWRSQRLAMVPDLLKRYGVSAWLVSQREYAEDTVFRSYKPATTFYARRRTLSLFHTNESAMAGKPNPITWIDPTPQLWTDVREVLESFQPWKIAINTDPTIAFSDGLHVGELEALKNGLGEKWSSRFASLPPIAVEFVAWRAGGTQLEWYRKMMESVWAMVDEGFSERVITPGVTTTDDVVWWFRERMQAMNVTTWFQTGVERFHPPSLANASTPFLDSNIIQPGDMLHTDIGITAMGLNTDTQHLGYVPLRGETDVPDGLKEGLRRGNRLQDIVLSRMAAGKTGNRALKETLAQMDEEDIAGLIYCHPIGDFGHSAGSVIGFWDHQEGMPIIGDLPILPNTYYSIELTANYDVPEWGIEIPFQLEEDVYWDKDTGKWEWVYGRQEKFHMVRWEKNKLVSQA